MVSDNAAASFSKSCVSSSKALRLHDGSVLHTMICCLQQDA